MTDVFLSPSAATRTDIALTLIELGAAIVGLAVLSRLATRIGLSAIPLYLLAGLAFGKGGLLPLALSQDFVYLSAEIGVILLLFMLGLKYTGEELSASLRGGLLAGIVDLALNFVPGLIAGYLLGWSLLACILLGGVTYVSSSGVIAKILAELGWQSNPETPVLLSILVQEDLAMAVFLPLISVLLIGQSLMSGLISVGIALITVMLVLFAALRYGKQISRLVSHRSDEIVLLTTFGLVLLVAGLAQSLQVSAAVGAFLVGVALSGPLAEQAHRVLTPLRDLFAAIFFFFFGLQIDPATLPPVLLLAVSLGIVTALTKVLTGVWAARNAGLNMRAGLRAGVSLVPRGEFSVVIAGLGAAIEPQLGPLAAAYILFLVILGSLLACLAAPALQPAQT